MKPVLVASITALLLSGAGAAARPLTANDMVMLRRLSEPAASPDGRLIAYQLRETDLAANRGRNDIWLVPAAGGASRKLAADPAHDETAPAFSPDGKSVYFLSDRSGGTQVWRMPVAGGAPVQVTRLARDIGGFKLAPTGDRIAVWVDEREDCDRPICAPAEEKGPKATGRTYDKLFVRHWDTWRDGTRSRLLGLELRDGVAVGEPHWVSRGLDGDTPSKPFGGGEDIAWSADGRTLYFTLREAGRTEAWSTNLDIFSAPASGDAAPVNLTADRPGMDRLPAVSPDGKWLAWGAMARATYEADRVVLMLREIATGKVRALTADWDRSVDSIVWAPDSRSLLVTADDHFDKPLFRVALADGRVMRLTGEGGVATAVPAGSALVYAISSLVAPADLFRLDGRRVSRLTAVNADRLAGIDMPAATRFSFKGAADDTVWGYVVQPPGLAADAKAPVAFLIHGGPQGSFGNAWSYRWNPAVFAGAGYGAVLIDFHGSTGYGQAFTDSINRDWGGKPLEDLRKGLKAATDRFAWLDGDRACALGGSYGGYMVNWIAGQWPDGFRCLVSHAGVFDARAMAYETEELWFDEWEHGGPYFEKSEEFEKWNPVRFVDRWKTPTLVIHGERDFRIPYTQGLGVFTALQRRDVPSRLLIYPDENHWVQKPLNSLQWYEESLGWLNRWTGAGR